MFSINKTVLSLLCLILAFTLVLPNNASARTNEVKSIEIESEQSYAEFTLEEIMALEKYISVNSEGLFVMNKPAAISDGHAIKLLEGQQSYLNYLNSDIKAGKIKAHKNLEIEDLGTVNLDSDLSEIVINGSFSTLPACGGVTTTPQKKVWGMTRKLNSCDANKYAAQLAGVAAGSGLTGVITFWIPGMPVAAGVAAGWAGLYSASLYAHNSHNTGVITNLSWAMVFWNSSQ